MARPKGSKNRQRTPEQMQELRARREQRRAIKKAAAARGNGLGNNAASLTDDQERALHYLHVSEYEEAQAAVKKAMASRKTVVARIKAEGGNIDQIKVSLELETPEGEERVAGRVNMTIKAMAWAGSNAQLDLFDGQMEQDDADYQRGKTAGLQGKTPGGDVSQHWMTGWHAGQDALMATLELFRAEPKRIVETRVDGNTTATVEDGVITEVTVDSGIPWMPPDDLTEGEVDAPSDETVP